MGTTGLSYADTYTQNKWFTVTLLAGLLQLTRDPQSTPFFTVFQGCFPHEENQPTGNLLTINLRAMAVVSTHALKAVLRTTLNNPAFTFVERLLLSWGP